MLHFLRFLPLKTFRFWNVLYMQIKLSFESLWNGNAAFSLSLPSRFLLFVFIYSNCIKITWKFSFRFAEITEIRAWGRRTSLFRENIILDYLLSIGSNLTRNSEGKAFSPGRTRTRTWGMEVASMRQPYIRFKSMEMIILYKQRGAYFIVCLTPMDTFCFACFIHLLMTQGGREGRLKNIFAWWLKHFSADIIE